MSIVTLTGIVVLAFVVTGCQTWTRNDLETKPAPASGSEQGVVNIYYWNGIPGSSLSELTSDPRFPSNPDEIVPISSLNSPVNRGDNYGALAKGFIEPPMDGNYQFFISSDDASELWLSSNHQQADAEIIASVPRWTFPQEFEKYASQKSGIRTLEAGNRYYFEVRFKEGSGDDHFTIAWAGPGFSRRVIPGDALYSWAPASESTDERSAQEAYHLGYRVGFIDGRENIAFNPNYPPTDSDGDGMYDNWEVLHGLNPGDPSDGSSDPDSDFLVATEEFFLGTAEGNADSDADGIPDGAEFALELDPLNIEDAQQDIDGDGYSNIQEYVAGTDLREASEKPEEPEITYLSGFIGQYFSGVEFNQLAYVRNDGVIDFFWSRYEQGPEGLPDNQFSIRWYSEFAAPHTSGAREYRFTVRSDDGVRLFLNDNLVIDEWQPQAATTFTHNESLSAGETVHLTLEYYEDAQDAAIEFSVTDLVDNQVVDSVGNFTVPDPEALSAGDSDGDQVPDTWELANGTQVWMADGDQVLNAQGVTNLQAYENGLVPRTLEVVGGGEPEGQVPPAEEEPVSTGAIVTVTWTAPSTREGGDSIALSEIQSYIVRYGTETASLDQRVEVSNGDTSYQFDNLGSGTWYFTVQAVDTNGLVSEPSEIVRYDVP